MSVKAYIEKINDNLEFYKSVVCFKQT